MHPGRRSRNTHWLPSKASWRRRAPPSAAPLALYQVHSLTEDSGALGDRALLAAMARLRSDGVMIGLTTSGPLQATTLRRALETTIDGEPLFSAAEVTWNLLEPSVEPAAAEAAEAGWAVLVKEAVANGRLAPGGDKAGPSSPLARLAATHGLTPDAVALAAALARPWAAVVLVRRGDPRAARREPGGPDGHRASRSRSRHGRTSQRILVGPVAPALELTAAIRVPSVATYPRPPPSWQPAPTRRLRTRVSFGW